MKDEDGVNYDPLTDEEMAAVDEHARYLLSLPGGHCSHGLDAPSPRPKPLSDRMAVGE